MNKQEQKDYYDLSDRLDEYTGALREIVKMPAKTKRDAKKIWAIARDVLLADEDKG